MQQIPSTVRRLVAAENSCGVVHFYPSFCDPSCAAETIDTAALTTAAEENADDATAYKLVYDVMRSRDGQILFRQSYAARIAHSLALAAPAHSLPSELAATVQGRLQRYIDTPGTYKDGVTEQNVKVVAWVDDATAEGSVPIPGLIFLQKSSYPPESLYREGAKLGFLYDAHRVNPNAKVAQTALRDRANAYQAENHIFEVLLVHSAADHYLVPEGSRSNYLLQRRDGTWWCSAEEDILVGITLLTAYRVVQACGLGTVQHAKLNVKDILECKSLYMLGTSPTILPIQSVLLYNDASTRQSFETAVQDLGIELHTGSGSAIVRSDDGSRAELAIPVDAALAAQLRAQYFAEAAAS